MINRLFCNASTFLHGLHGMSYSFPKYRQHCDSSIDLWSVMLLLFDKINFTIFGKYVILSIYSRIMWKAIQQRVWHMNRELSISLSDLRTFGLQNLRHEEPFISELRTFGLQNFRTREQSTSERPVPRGRVILIRHFGNATIVIQWESLAGGYKWNDCLIGRYIEHFFGHWKRGKCGLW